jgi:hypothetical protein
MHSPAMLQRLVDGLSFDLELELLLELVRADLLASLDDPTRAQINALDRYLVLRLFDEVIRPAIEALHEAANQDDDEEAPVTDSQTSEGTIHDVS